MPWSLAVLLAAGLVLVVAGAGAAVLVAAGARPRDAASAAPAVGTGVVVVSGVVAAELRVTWGLPVVVVAVAGAALLAALLAGRLGRRRLQEAAADTATAAVGPDRAPTPRFVTAAAVALGSLLCLVPLAVAMGRPDRVQNAWDALFHLAAVDLLRSGGPTDLRDVSELAAPGGGITYPFGWHVVAALAPAGVDPFTAVNVAGLVPVVVFGVAGTAALARALFPAVPYVGPVAAVLTAAAVGAPLAIAIQPGLIPNAYGLSLVPGALAVVVRAGRVTPAAALPVVLAATGIAMSHPGALLGLLLLAVPWVAARCVGWVRAPGWRSQAGQRRLLVAGLGTCGVALVALLVLGRSPTAAAVAGTRVKEPLSAGEITRRLLTGDLGEWSATPWVLTACVAVGTVVLAVRRQHLRLLAAAMLAVATYASAASSWPFLSSLTALWYTEIRRIAPFVGLLATVIAAYGVVTLSTWLRGVVRRPGRTRRGADAVAVLCAVAVMTGCVATGVRAIHDNASDAFTQDVVADPQPMSRHPYLTRAEEQMIVRLADVLGPDDLVLGSSLSGVGHLAVMAGTRAVQPYHTVPLAEDAELVGARLADIGQDPAVCGAVRRLGATHVYVDPYPLHSTYWERPRPVTFTARPGAAAPVVDSGGTASVHALDACYADRP